MIWLPKSGAISFNFASRPVRHFDGRFARRNAYCNKVRQGCQITSEINSITSQKRFLAGLLAALLWKRALVWVQELHVRYLFHSAARYGYEHVGHRRA